MFTANCLYNLQIAYIRLFRLKWLLLQGCFTLFGQEIKCTWSPRYGFNFRNERCTDSESNALFSVCDRQTDVQLSIMPVLTSVLSPTGKIEPLISHLTNRRILLYERNRYLEGTWGNKEISVVGLNNLSE